MRQVYHTIIKQKSDHFYVGWVEEMPGTLTHGRTLRECRDNLREALALMIQTHRDEARLSLDETCITEPIEIEIEDDAPDLAHV